MPATAAPTAGGSEEVVLLSDDGRVVGAAPKASVHGPNTPLHLAFSCYVFDRDGNVLVTRRALGKPTWPGVWTNSFCGHPAPGEEVPAAVMRRANQELGVMLRDVRCVLPDFRYRAVAADGTVENEVCPVYCAWTDSELAASPAEIMEHRWMPWTELCAAARFSWTISPWATVQIPLLNAAGVATAPRTSGPPRP